MSPWQRALTTEGPPLPGCVACRDAGQGLLSIHSCVAFKDVGPGTRIIRYHLCLHGFCEARSGIELERWIKLVSSAQNPPPFKTTLYMAKKTSYGNVQKHTADNLAISITCQVQCCWELRPPPPPQHHNVFMYFLGFPCLSSDPSQPWVAPKFLERLDVKAGWLLRKLATLAGEKIWIFPSMCPSFSLTLPPGKVIFLSRGGGLF